MSHQELPAAISGRVGCTIILGFPPLPSVCSKVVLDYGRVHVCPLEGWHTGDALTLLLGGSADVFSSLHQFTVPLVMSADPSFVLIITTQPLPRCFTFMSEEPGGPYQLAPTNWALLAYGQRGRDPEYAYYTRFYVGVDEPEPEPEPEHEHEGEQGSGDDNSKGVKRDAAKGTSGRGKPDRGAEEGVAPTEVQKRLTDRGAEEEVAPTEVQKRLTDRGAEEGVL